MPTFPESSNINMAGYRLLGSNGLDKPQIEQIQRNLNAWHGGEELEINGGDVIGELYLDQRAATHLLRHAPGLYSICSYDDQHYKGLDPDKLYLRDIIDSLHSAFKSIVTLDAARAEWEGLEGPETKDHETRLGLYSELDNWHIDGIDTIEDTNQSSQLLQEQEDDNYPEIFRAGLLRYTVSIGVPGTEFLAGRIDKKTFKTYKQYIDRNEEDRLPGKNFRRVTHAAYQVVRFVSDYNIHRPPRIAKKAPRYFSTTSVVIPRSEYGLAS
jgi:hypothetical protein